MKSVYHVLKERHVMLLVLLTTKGNYAHRDTIVHLALMFLLHVPQELSVLTKVEPNLDLLYGALLLNRP